MFKERDSETENKERDKSIRSPPENGKLKYNGGQASCKQGNQVSRNLVMFWLINKNLVELEIIIYIRDFL